MKKSYFFVFVFFASALAAQQDSILGYDVFIRQIRDYHPLSLKADLLVDAANAGLLEAKGGFDPILDFKKADKNFSGTTYYDKNALSLKWPTPWAVQLNTGIERAEGVYLDPETTVGTISYLGLDLPLLKGLWMDERRAALQMAKQNRNQSEEARILAYNQVVSSAAQAYWTWLEKYEVWRLTTDTWQLAEQRKNLLRTLFVNGDRSEADTMELFIQVNQLRMQRDERRTEYLNASLQLSNFVWRETLFDSLMTGKIFPVKTDWQRGEEEGLKLALSNVPLLSNPAVKWYEFKLKALEIEQRYKKQMLLPELNLSTRLLSKNSYQFSGLDRFYFTENYLLGVQFKMPLLLREGRGALQKTKIKIRDTQWDMQLKVRDLANKENALTNELALLVGQIENISALIQAQSRLYALEISRFNLGESSVFLVNAREQKLLELKGKEVEMKAKRAKVIAKLYELRATFL
ncbi:MAG: TolC family protein [Saprospiraceae bacterium]|nr:TolC family protein [Saprospiraceae bacterium]